MGQNKAGAWALLSLTIRAGEKGETQCGQTQTLFYWKMQKQIYQKEILRLFKAKVFSKLSISNLSLNFEKYI